MPLSNRWPHDKPDIGSWHRNIADAALLIAALISGSLATYYTYRSSEAARAQQVREQLSVISQSVIDGFYPDLLRSIEAVRATGLMVGTKRIQSRNEFVQFAEAILANAPKISSLQWQPNIIDSQLSAFEAATRQEGMPEYRVVQQLGSSLVPVSPRPTYAPILYSFPENFSPPGLDISFSSQRMDSKLLAKKTRQPMASATLPLITTSPELSGKIGFYISTAVFHAADHAANNAAESLIGYVSGAILVEDLFQEAAFRSDAAYLELRVFDQGSNSHNLIYSSANNNSSNDATLSNDDQTTPEDVRIEIDIVGQPWEVLLRPRPHFYDSQSSNSLSVAGFGSLSTLLVIFGIYATQRSRRSISILQATTELTEQRLSRILDGTRAGTWEWHVPSGVLHVNEHWVRMLGYTLTELSPINIETWRNLCHPADLVKASSQIDLHIAGKTDKYDCELRMHHKDGHWVWVFARGSLIPLGTASRMEWLAGTHMDISESKRVMQQMSDIRDALDSHAIVAIANRSGQITYVNNQFCNVSRYSRDELVGANFHILNSGYHSRDYFTTLWLTISSGKTWKGEIRDRTKDGNFIWLDSTIAPILGDSGTPSQYIAIYYDITDKKLHQEQLQAAKEAAEAANRAKGDFLANMSHELRTPMNAILGLSNIISRSALTIDQRDCIRNLIQSGNLLLNIINDVLDYSKIDAGRLELEKSSFSLRNLLDTVAAVVSANISKKDLEILIGASIDVPDILIGDSLRLQQVLINLIGNAIKFTEVGEVVVQVTVIEQDIDSIKLRFEIRDTGIGISPDTVGRLFTPATQGDASTTRRFGGSGLGLAICGKLVRLMDGEINVESNLGHGSTFWFTTAFHLGNPTQELTERRAYLTKGNLSVLIVDDNPTARTIIADTIASLGWCPDCAKGGLEAIEKIRVNQSYDFVLVDWRMPEMGGLETIRAIRSMKTQKRIQIVAMVSAIDRDDALKADSGSLVDNILFKPLSGSMLYDLASTNFHSTTLTDWTNANEHNSEQTLAGVSVLLVEDNTINQDVARRILELEHAKVTIANNGQEAIDLLKSCPTAYDLVLMDIQMPVMDGYEATRIIRSSLYLADLPIIALTAGVMASDRQRAEAAGVNGFVPKPFDLNQLVSTVARHCGRHSISNSSMLSLETETNALFDPNDALSRAGGNHNLCRSLLKRFAEQFRSITTDLPILVDAADLSGLTCLIHTLRGVAGNIGARRLSALAGKIEDDLRNSPGFMPLPEFDVLIKLVIETLNVIEASPLLVIPVPASTSQCGNVDVNINALRLLLKESNIAAIDAFTTMSGSIRSIVGDERYLLIERSINDLNFSTALEQLSEQISDDN